MRFGADVKIIKKIPEREIEEFTDKTVYNVAVLTRETAKELRAFPRRTGRLEETEIQQHITGSNKEYGLSAGVDYAVYMYNLDKANWTNPKTEPHWYYNIYDRYKKTIVMDAVSRAKKEV